MLAALSAARHGLSVGLIDEAAAAGGQIYRAPAPGMALLSGKRDDDAERGTSSAPQSQLPGSGVLQPPRLDRGAQLPGRCRR